MPAPVRPDPRGVDRYLAGVPEPMRSVGRAARRVVRSTAPRLTETMKRGRPFYIGRREVVYIAAYASHVNLGFYRGALLTDGTGRLEGTGQGLRHVKLRTADDAETPAVRQLIRSAARLDAA